VIIINHLYLRKAFKLFEFNKAFHFMNAAAAAAAAAAAFLRSSQSNNVVTN
jgi:pterin-4a-carbinolamine dehydratase